MAGERNERPEGPSGRLASDPAPADSPGSAGEADPPRQPPRPEDFLDHPTRELADWHWLWKRDEAFPIRSDRGLLGRLLVAVKRLFRPLVKVPQNDLWERQRVFNLILLEALEERARERSGQDHEGRIRHLEAFMADGLEEVMRHNDALFARVDQKLDRYRREARELELALGAALAALEAGGGARGSGAKGPGAGEATAPLALGLEERDYLELEHRYRGTSEDVSERIGRYLGYLEGRPGPVLDLGCGRGEALAVLAERGIPARGVDGSARMVQLCREQGLQAEEGDLFQHLAGVAEASLGAVVSFHVIEHLPAERLALLVRLAWRALAPGGVLILETPNPLSVVVAARSFWLDPTHRRPIHPESLRLAFELAGFEAIEHLELRPFEAADRLPELDLSALPEEQHQLADRVNRLRDRLDETLFGFQDYALVGFKPG